MIKYIKNITSTIITLLLLSGGNFVFALAHGDCIIDSNGHISCEMESCYEIPYDDEENNGEVQIKNDSYSCCNVHIEQSLKQVFTLRIIAKKPELSKTFLFNINTASILNVSSRFFPVFEKFKTTNIFLVVSNLRI